MSIDTIGTKFVLTLSSKIADALAIILDGDCPDSDIPDKPPAELQDLSKIDPSALDGADKWLSKIKVLLLLID